MNKTIVKLGLASTVLLGSASGLSSHHAHAATHVSPYYHWNGYTGRDYNFVLDPQFKNALFNGDVTINGLKIDKKAVVTKKDMKKSFAAHMDYTNHGKSSKYLAVNHDTIGYKTSKGKIFDLEIPVKKNMISEKQIFKLYGRSFIGSGGVTGPDHKEVQTSYTYNTKDDVNVSFYFDQHKKLEKIQLNK